MFSLAKVGVFLYLAGSAALARPTEASEQREQRLALENDIFILACLDPNYKQCEKFGRMADSPESCVAFPSSHAGLISSIMPPTETESYRKWRCTLFSEANCEGSQLDILNPYFDLKSYNFDNVASSYKCHVYRE